ncbi:unnamed protein product, partial [marine sediment metagenome]
IESMCFLGIFSWYGKHVIEGCADIVTPQIKQAAGAITGRATNYTIEKIVSSPQSQLQATAGKRATVNIEISIAIIKLGFLRVTNNPDR